MMQTLRRYFPSTPDWILGGLLGVLLLWLIVLPAEFFQITIRHQYFPMSFWDWVIKFFYIWGYAISLFTVAPLAQYSSTPDQPAGLVTVLFGLFITSPVYFFIGALLATRKAIVVTLGVVLATVHLVVSCVVAFWLLKFLFGG